jgi:hypothetical protein
MKMNNIGTLNQQKVKSTGSESNNMRFSEDASAIIFNMFTSNIYSNPIGSFIREITSNCYDAHAEANVNFPVIVKLTKSDNEEHFISFIDKGVGISPERMKNIYSVYFKSTKRLTNNEIGGFGIGGKCPLAYKRSTGVGEDEYDNSFFVNTNYDGTKYHYVVYEGENSPRFDLLFSEKTSERNGTEVKVPVLAKDLYTINNEIKKQLYYFENIVFEGFNTDFNQYQIIKANSFIYRPGNTYSDMHICLGKVAYPIDYSVLGLNRYDYNVPVAIKLNIGDINVTASREALDYSEKAIKLLKSKIKEVKDELTDMLQKQAENVITLFDYYNVKSNLHTLKLTDEHSLEISGIVPLNSFGLPNFKFKNLDVIPEFNEILNLISQRYIYGEDLKNKKKLLNEIRINTIKEKVIYHTLDFKRKTLKQKYLRDLHYSFRVIDFDLNPHDINLKNIDLDNPNEYYWLRHLLREVTKLTINMNTPLDKRPSNQEILDMIIEVYDYVMSNSESYDDVVVDKEFIKEEKERKQQNKDLYERDFVLNFYTTRGYKRKIKNNLNYLKGFKGVIFYGTTENNTKVYDIASAHADVFNGNHNVSVNYHNTEFTKKQGILFAYTAVSNEKYLKELKNAYPIDMYKEKMLYRKADNVVRNIVASNIKDNFNNIPNFFSKSEIKDVNKSFGEKIEQLKSFFNNKKTNTWYPQIIRQMLSAEIEKYKQSADVKKIEKTLKSVLTTIEKNKKTVGYINYNTYFDDKDYIKFLKKVLVF